jgi:hypothetical protein
MLDAVASDVADGAVAGFGVPVLLRSLAEELSPPSWGGAIIRAKSNA